MTDTGREYALTGDHAENLHSGAMLSPGERVTDEQLDDTDRWLIDEGRLVEVAQPEPPTLTARRNRARDLGIRGYGRMSADELDTAIKDAEAPILTAADDGVAQGDTGKDGDR